MTIFICIVAYLLWVAFNWLAPLAVVRLFTPLSIAQLPGEILARANGIGVDYYKARLAQGLAFTVWSWPRKIVVINEDFLLYGKPSVIRFVLAHELGHIALGHTFKRWLAIVTFVYCLPFVRKWLKDHEYGADEYAEQLTGVSRSVLHPQEPDTVIAANDEETLPPPAKR